MKGYNHLMDDMKPIVGTDKERLQMIVIWRQHVLNIDMEDANNWSQRQYEDQLDVFFNNYPYDIEERDLSVIASLLNWLPSNCGSAFLYDAENLSKLHGSIDKGYLYAWAAENRRQVGINCNRTLLEFLLTPEDQHDINRGLTCAVNKFVSVRDIECSNYFVDWLSSSHGRSFLETASSRFSKINIFN